MKIRFDIQEQYRDLELHICTDRSSEAALALKDTLERLLLPRITVHGNQESKVISATELVRIYSESKRVYARTEKETFEVRDRLYVLEEQLRDKGFVRISNSEIVNVSRIRRLDLHYAGTIRICMTNGDETYVSRRYVSRIKEELR